MAKQILEVRMVSATDQQTTETIVQFGQDWARTVDLLEHVDSLHVYEWGCGEPRRAAEHFLEGATDYEVRRFNASGRSNFSPVMDVIRLGSLSGWIDDEMVTGPILEDIGVMFDSCEETYILVTFAPPSVIAFLLQHFGVVEEPIEPQAPLHEGIRLVREDGQVKVHVLRLKATA